MTVASCHALGPIPTIVVWLYGCTAVLRAECSLAWTLLLDHPGPSGTAAQTQWDDM